MKVPFPVLAILACAMGRVVAGQIFVAPDGSDQADGSPAHPFATVLRARDAARAALRHGESIEVILRAGTYVLPAPLELGPEDSGTPAAPALWRAADGAEVRLSAGRPVRDWKPVSDPAILGRLDPAARDHVLVAHLKAQGIADYGEMKGGFALEGSPGIELFIDDAPATIARYPNDGFIKIDDVPGPTVKTVRGITGAVEGILRVNDPRLARWTREKDIQVLGYWFWDWAEQRQKVASIDPVRHTLTLAQPWHKSGYRKGQYFYAYNLLSEIDRPGEWVLDRSTGDLTLWPPGDKPPARAMVTVLPSLVKLDHASHLTLRGLIFEGARAHSVLLNDCENVALDHCTIRNGGKWAVRISGGRDCAVRNCDITNMGAGGVFINAGDRRTLTPGHHAVENCHIHHYGRWSRTYQPGIRLEGVGQRAAHNLIHDAPHQAIGFAGNDHVIEYNEIHNVCEETNDAGAIYAWNDWAARGHQIRFNYIHHIQGRNGEGANGVYLDDAFSSADIHGNIFEAVVRPIHLGGGRDHRVANNLFVNCPRALHIDARGLGWRAFGYDELKAKLGLWPIQKPPWSERYPALLELLADEPMAPKGNVVTRNILVASPWDDIEEKAKPFVTMTDNLLDAPPEILASRPGQMPRVNPNAPAVQAIKFEPIPYGQIGLQRPAIHPVKERAWAPKVLNP